MRVEKRREKKLRNLQNDEDGNEKKKLYKNLLYDGDRKEKKNHMMTFSE